MTHLNFAMTTLLNGIWQGALLAAAMWLLLKLIPRVNPTTRFTALWLMLLAVVALPLGPLAPRISLPASLFESQVATMPATAPSTSFAPIELRQPQLKPAVNSESFPESKSQSVSGPAPESTPVRKSNASSLSTAVAPTDHPLIRIRSGKLLSGVEILWILLSLVMFVRLGIGYLHLRRLKSSATPAPEDLRIKLMDLCAMNGVRRQSRLLVSSKIAAPMSLGFLNPAILIPRALLDTLSESEVEHIVLHELAHLRRHDDWTNLAQKFIEALLPIQPAVFWIGRRMSLEREMACDDWVIEATGTPTPYAASLAKVAELSHWERAGILAAGAAGNRSQLFRRVQHMLDRTRNAAPKLTLGPLAVALAAVAALVYAGTRAPQLIAFAQNPANENIPQISDAPTAPFSAPAPLARPTPPTPSVLQSPQTLRAPTAPHSLSSSQSLAPLPPSNPQALAPLSSFATSEPLSPVAPFPPVAAAAQQQKGNQHTEMTTRNGWSSTSVKIDGTVEFTDDDRDVKSLSPNGRFRLEDGGWFSARVYEVKADSAGNLTKTYSVGWSTKPLDNEARAWLDHLLPQIIRDSGMGADARVARILRQGGVQAVLTEIGLIHSDGSRRTYIELLFSQATLNTTQLKDAAKLIKDVSSDGDKAQLIIAVDKKYFTGELRAYLFEAAESISSDGDKRNVLTDIAQKDAASPETLTRVARAAKHISSDGDKAEVLINIADPYRASDELRVAYFDAVNSISSDGDRARVLSTLLASHGDDRATLVRVLRSAQNISSDGDKARVLKEVVPRYTEDESVRNAFFDAVNSIASDGDHQQVLVALVHRQGNGPGTLAGIANSACRISSDGDKARVLSDLAAANIEPFHDAFFAAAGSIASDGDRTNVLIVLLDNPGTSIPMVVAAIHSAAGISSDGDKSRVLLDAANKYSKDPVVNAALRKALESLQSDGEYRAIMSRISRRDETK